MRIRTEIFDKRKKNVIFKVDLIKLIWQLYLEIPLLRNQPVQDQSICHIVICISLPRPSTLEKSILTKAKLKELRVYENSLSHEHLLVLTDISDKHLSGTLTSTSAFTIFQSFVKWCFNKIFYAYVQQLETILIFP